MIEGIHKTRFKSTMAGDFIGCPSVLCFIGMFLNGIPLREFFVC